MSTATAPDRVGPGSRRRLDVDEAMATRRSVRAYLPRPVPREDVEEILALAARTASNSNTQPWHVHVVTGAAKRDLTEALWEALAADDRTTPEYPYQPDPDDWSEPLRSRRRRFGEELYGSTLGVEASDTAGRLAHHRRNYAFFGAPVGLVLTVDRQALGGGLVDAGAFLQAIVLLARARGLDTCPQASFLDFHPVVRRHLRIPAEQMMVCGVALGYADEEHALDDLRTEREPVAGFTTFHV
ncbi:nitroreductase [Actinomycetospora chiangmaiensis]|uniref:nitroreductase n=1 Tax=Actinomycetospora chiangmaiensis TaxID=402650 RepID=UPI00036FC2AA|nr:nitroreductase [Actinomycetospora chiangmaiensis]